MKMLSLSRLEKLITYAVVNCSFLQGSIVQVAIYDNRLEISSPGGLMPGVTLEKMKEGFSKVRNHGIANAFVYMNLIEQWGSGIPKILAQTKEYGLPEVELIDMGIALRVNMYRALSEDEKQAIKTSDKNKRQMTKENDSRSMFAEYMSQHGASSTAEIAAFSGLSPQRTRAILAKMVEDGIVIAEGANKKRKYRLQ